jgi:hypothetical protein
MIKSSTVAALAALALGASAPAGLTVYNFGLSGAQEVAPNSSTALGVATIIYDTTSDVFDITVLVVGIGLSDLRPVGPNGSPIHIHMAPPGVNGGIVIDLGFLSSFMQAGLGIQYSAIGVTAGGTYGGISSDPALVRQAFDAGNLYVNIHTNNYPGGEIRGQIPPIPLPTPATAALIGAAGLVVVARRRA